MSEPADERSATDPWLDPGWMAVQGEVGELLRRFHHPRFYAGDYCYDFAGRVLDVLARYGWTPPVIEAGEAPGFAWHHLPIPRPAEGDVIVVSNGSRSVRYKVTGDGSLVRDENPSEGEQHRSQNQ